MTADIFVWRQVQFNEFTYLLDLWFSCCQFLHCTSKSQWNSPYSNYKFSFFFIILILSQFSDLFIPIWCMVNLRFDFEWASGSFVNTKISWRSRDATKTVAYNFHEKNTMQWRIIWNFFTELHNGQEDVFLFDCMEFPQDFPGVGLKVKYSLDESHNSI